MSREHIARELELYVAKTIALASEGKPYQEVLQAIGKVPEGETVSIHHPDSQLFREIITHVGAADGKNPGRIMAVEFISKPGAYTMNDLRDAFGEWHRSPPEPQQVSYAVAWFPRYDTSSGASYFLYAEDGGYHTSIAPDSTPERLFLQVEPFRW